MYFESDDVDAFTTAAIGEPGSRTFYLQIRSQGRHITMKCEKQQVAALSQYIRQLLADAPDVKERPLDDAMQMTTPLDVEFIVDLADDLLNRILDGDEPRHTTVLIDHDRHMIPAATELPQQHVDTLGLGYDDDGSHELADVELVLLTRCKNPQDILGKQDPDDVVPVIVGDWISRVPRLDDRRQ